MRKPSEKGANHKIKGTRVQFNDGRNPKLKGSSVKGWCTRPKMDEGPKTAAQLNLRCASQVKTQFNVTSASKLLVRRARDIS